MPKAYWLALKMDRHNNFWQIVCLQPNNSAHVTEFLGSYFQYLMFNTFNTSQILKIKIQTLFVLDKNTRMVRLTVT